MIPSRHIRLTLLPALILGMAGVVCAAPRILVAPTSLDVGSLGQNEVREASVLIRNAGDEPLEISELFSSCPCTLPRLGSDLIAPGGSAEMIVSFHSKDMQGEIHKTIEIYSNDPEHSYLEVHVSARVLAPVLVEPSDRKLDFGDVPAAGAERIASFRAEELEILELSLEDYDSACFECSLRPDPEGDVRSVQLSVKVLAGAEPGPFKGVIRLKTNVPGAPVIDLEAFGTVTAQLVAEPALINFRFVQPGQQLEREVSVLDSSGGSDFRLTGVEIDLPGFTAEWVEGESLVRISGQALGTDHSLARESRGRIKGDLRIFTDHAGQPELKVKVMYMLRM